MRRAFTILELLAATALTALLMVAVLHVVGAIGAGRAALSRQADAGAWRTDLLDLLRRDLANASKISFGQNSATLIGHGALDAATLELRHEPVTVVYGLSVIDGRSWLVRRQSPREGLSNAPAWGELICPDINGLAIMRVNGPAGAIAAAPSAVPEEVPSAVTVLLNGPDGPVMNQTLVLR